MTETAPLPSLDHLRIAVIGLGYVGLPLAVEFAKKRPIIGFDIDHSRIAALRRGYDATHEVSTEEMADAPLLSFTNDPADLRNANLFIVTVPTPIDSSKRPNLTPLIKASETIGKVLKRGDIVIYESTVYPGATEEDCVPVLEQQSGIVFNKDFYAGYSPERINPGDKAHRLPSIKKVTSGSTPEVADLIDDLYATIITAGTHKAPSIRVAEAAKVIENTQRDLNIALVNELALIFSRLDLDTKAVLEAAGTKWNFLPFKPGLVGGHCIGVDPYYLTHKAIAVGYNPEVILAGRRVNDSMGVFVAQKLVKSLLRSGNPVKDARVLVLGLTFKENCPDLRNSRVFDVIDELVDFGMHVDACDPMINPSELNKTSTFKVVEAPEKGYYDGVILAVAHQKFVEMGAGKIRQLGGENHIFFDLKSVFEVEESDLRL